MSFDPQKPVSEENPLPTSPQEPTEPALENTAHSEPSEALPEAPESSPSDFEVKSTDIPPSNSTPVEPSGEQKPDEKQAEIGLLLGSFSVCFSSGFCSPEGSTWV